MGIYQFVKLMMNNATITFRENYTVRAVGWTGADEGSAKGDLFIWGDKWHV